MRLLIYLVIAETKNSLRLTFLILIKIKINNLFVLESISNLFIILYIRLDFFSRSNPNSNPYF
jgi:hypothetical protein